MKKLAEKTGLPLVATQDIHYAKPEDADYHDILLAVQTGNKLSDDDRLTLKIDDFSMRSPEEMTEFFKDVPEAIENTVKIAERCNVSIKLGGIMLPNFPLPENETSAINYLKSFSPKDFPEDFPKTAKKQKSVWNTNSASLKKWGLPITSLLSKTSSIGQKTGTSSWVRAEARPPEAWFHMFWE
jgi:DNA polymerase-3 subunit alpha